MSKSEFPLQMVVEMGVNEGEAMCVCVWLLYCHQEQTIMHFQ